MSVLDALRQARALIAGGWSEPMSTDSAGNLCLVDDEAIAKFCVADALTLACRGRCSYLEAEDALKAVLVPAWSSREGFELRAAVPPTDEELSTWVSLCQAKGAAVSLSEWLEHPARKLEHVLRGFTLAILRAKSQLEAA